MNDSCNTVTVAILAFPETSASVVYGIYDLFMSAGRDWGIIVDGAPGPQLINPLVVSAQTGPFTVSNNVQIAPQATLAPAEHSAYQRRKATTYRSRHRLPWRPAHP